MTLFSGAGIVNVKKAPRQKKSPTTEQTLQPNKNNCKRGDGGDQVWEVTITHNWFSVSCYCECRASVVHNYPRFQFQVPLQKPKDNRRQAALLSRSHRDL